jgi:hypothetical protein
MGGGKRIVCSLPGRAVMALHVGKQSLLPARSTPGWAVMALRVGKTRPYVRPSPRQDGNGSVVSCRAWTAPYEVARCVEKKHPPNTGAVVEIRVWEGRQPGNGKHLIPQHRGLVTC